MQPNPEPDEGLTSRQLDTRHWCGSWGSQLRGTIITLESAGWVAYLRLGNPPGLSPITTVGRFAMVEEAQVVWAAR
jgi:hypothetical protein